MKKLFFTAFALSLSLSALAGKHHEARARLYPSGLLNRNGTCTSSYEYKKCTFPSLASLKADVSKFEENFKNAINEVLEKADVFEAEAKILEAMAEEGNFANPKLTNLYLAGAKAMRTRYEALHSGQSEVFMNLRAELDSIQSLILNIDQLTREGLSDQIQKTYADYYFGGDNYKHDERYYMSALLSGDTLNLFIFQVKLDETFGRGNIRLLENTFEYFLVGKKHVSQSKFKDNYLSLEDDKELLKKLFDTERPFIAEYKTHSAVAPAALAKASTSYNGKNNKLIIGRKRSDIIAFETHHDYYLPKEGIVPFLRKKMGFKN